MPDRPLTPTTIPTSAAARRGAGASPRGHIGHEQARRVASAFLDAPRRSPTATASADGEHSAWLAEDGLYTGLARWALATELHGEHSVLWTSGTLADHKAVLLDPALLRASRAGSGAVGTSAPHAERQFDERPGRSP